MARGAKTGNKILGLFGVPGAENEICLDGELNHRTVLVWLRFSRGNNAKNLTFSSSFFFLFSLIIIRLILEKAAKSRAVPQIPWGIVT